MSDPANPRREHPSTYFVQDRSNEEELTRLHIQDQMLTASMGGVLPEQPDPTRFQSVLDVGCATADWLIETAKAYPGLSRLVGVDISSKMLAYARAQADAQQVSDRTEFHTMDVLRILEFPNDSFDLVNQRFGFSYLRTWEWPKLLSEFLRVSSPGGVIRVTEPDILAKSSSPAMLRLGTIQLQAFYQAGHLFTPAGDGVSNELARLLRQHGFQNVQTRVQRVEYHAGTPQGQRFYDDMKHLFRTAVPFYRKWTHVPDDYETIYQQVLDDIQRPDFVATVNLLTAWGNKPK
jgi:ubiquinone/menaquinone biosynthesis C-methylase UbiE